MNDEHNDIEAVSLDNRKSQLTQKVEQLSNAQIGDSVLSSGAIHNDAQSSESNANAVLSESDSALVQEAFQPVGASGSDTINNESNRKYETANPYGTDVSMKDYTGGMAAPKQRLSGGLKIYLIVIIGLCVIFMGMFVFECTRAYKENGLFGGDLDRFMDSDFAFDFDYPDTFGGDSAIDDQDDTDDESSSDGCDSVVSMVPNDDVQLFDGDAADNLKAEDQPSDIDSVNYSARTAYKKVENSVVNVVTYDKEMTEDNKTGSGSGIILTEDGYIATNSHVVNDSKNTLTEVILNNDESYAATIIGIDVRTDLAVLKINAQGLVPVEFVNSDQIEVGQDAIAVGSPGGVKYSNSLTRGCVSALNRTVKSNALVPYIQTDAAINPGNSGGPLLNSAGQVMGINTIKIANSDYEGMGFAIPSNTVLSIVKDIMKQGYVSGRVRIGIAGITATSETALPGAPNGVVVLDITEDSPLKKTQIEINDIITAVNGEEIDGMSALFSELGKYQPGDEVTLSVTRMPTATAKAENFEVKITLLADNGETQE